MGLIGTVCKSIRGSICQSVCLRDLQREQSNGDKIDSPEMSDFCLYEGGPSATALDFAQMMHHSRALESWYYVRGVIFARAKS